MNKSKLIEYVQTNAATKLTKGQAADLVDTVLNGITSGLTREDSDELPKVRLSGFGTFSVRQHKERVSYGFNLTKGSERRPVTIEARRSVHFKASEAVREQLRDAGN
jgi:nucleoid DNA-binding protein